jgi:hypothetical protein
MRRSALRLFLALLSLAALAPPASATAGDYPWLGLADGQVGEFQWSVKV